MFTCIKSLNRYNLRHNNCIIFSIFLYFKYTQFSFEFIHLQICTRYNLFVHRKKSYQLLICRVAKNLPVLGLLNHFIKSSSTADKRVAYKKSLVYFAWLFCWGAETSISWLTKPLWKLRKLVLALTEMSRLIWVRWNNLYKTCAHL